MKFFPIKFSFVIDKWFGFRPYFHFQNYIICKGEDYQENDSEYYFDFIWLFFMIKIYACKYGVIEQSYKGNYDSFFKRHKNDIYALVISK